MLLAFLLYCILLYYKCLGETIFKLNLLGNLWATQTWMFKSLPRFGEFSAIISLSFLLPSSSLLLGSINLRFFLTVISHRSGRLYSFFFYLFSFFCLIHSNTDALCFTNFHFIHCILQLQKNVWIFSTVSISLLNFKKKCVLFFLFQWIVLLCFLVTHLASLNNYSEFFVG